jgi:hypothetical protein
LAEKPDPFPPAGWYPDPAAGAAARRWWDGAQWTEHRTQLGVRRAPWSPLDKALLVLLVLSALLPVGLLVAHDGICAFAPCDPADRLGVTKAQDGVVELVLYPCSGDRAVTAAVVSAGPDDIVDTNDDRTFWRVSGRATADAVRFRVGREPPDGFRQVTPLIEPLPRTGLTAVVETGIFHSQGFTAQNLQPEVITYLGRPRTPLQFERKVRRSASCKDFTEQGPPAWEGPAILASWSVALVVATWLVLRRRKTAPTAGRRAGSLAAAFPIAAAQVAEAKRRHGRPRPYVPLPTM